MDDRVEIRRGVIYRKELRGDSVHVKIQGIHRWVLAFIKKCRILELNEDGELIWEKAFPNPTSLFVPGVDVIVKIRIKPDGWIHVLRMTTLENYGKLYSDGSVNSDSDRSSGIP
jgi:hypothetical protein